MGNNQTYEYDSQEKEYFMLREEIMTIIKSYYENLKNMVAVYPVILGLHGLLVLRILCLLR